MTHPHGSTPSSAQTAPSALSIDGAQPVWFTLNAARERAFTGEVVFELDPEVLAYFDNGVVYYAERARDVSLGRRLVESGMLNVEQLERGTVRVGDIDHLGRLFDRDVTVDRDAVLVAVETATEDLIAELANRAVAAVRVTAYRHHPSGVHRWFVAPVDHARQATVSAGIGSLGSALPDDLPDLGLSGFEAQELTIEWDQPVDLLDVADEPPAPPAEALTVDDDPAPAPAFESPFDEAFDDPFDDVVEVETFADLDDGEPPLEQQLAPLAPVGDESPFSVVWPDGSEDVASEPQISEPEFDEPDFDEPSLSLTDLVFDGQPETPATGADDRDIDDAPVFDVGLTDTTEVPLAAPTIGNGEVRFEIPALALNVDPSDDGSDTEVADDVADAVRRAIAAIESAAAAAPAPSEPDAPDEMIEWPAIDWAPADPAEAAATVDASGPVVPEPAPATGPTGFAPPTMSTRAEVLYGIDDSDDLWASTDTPASATDGPADATSSNGPAAEPTVPAPGVASVVFVDEEGDSGNGEEQRTSSLRRLIGSLRRRDY